MAQNQGKNFYEIMSRFSATQQHEIENKLYKVADIVELVHQKVDGCPEHNYFQIVRGKNGVDVEKFVQLSFDEFGNGFGKEFLKNDIKFTPAIVRNIDGALELNGFHVFAEDYLGEMTDNYVNAGKPLFDGLNWVSFRLLAKKCMEKNEFLKNEFTNTSVME